MSEKLINSPEEAIECIMKNYPKKKKKKKKNGYYMLREALDTTISALREKVVEKENE